MVDVVHFNILKTPVFSWVGYCHAVFIEQDFMVGFKIAISIVFIVI